MRYESDPQRQNDERHDTPKNLLGNFCQHVLAGDGSDDYTNDANHNISPDLRELMGFGDEVNRHARG